MSRIDMFCAADDQHRVVLLVDLLQQAGQAVVLRPEPVAEPTDPCLVACTRRSLREPWIIDLFASAPAVVAVRLDDTPLPGPCVRVINMQNWPARSADRKVGSLVGWLLLHGQRGERVELAAGGSDAVSAGGVASSGSGQAARDTEGWRPRRRVRQRASDGLRALLVVGLLGLGGGLLWMAAPDADRAADAGDPDAEPAMAVPDPAVAVTEAADAVRGPPGQAGGPAAPAAGPASGADAGETARLQTAEAVAGAAPAGAAVAAGEADPAGADFASAAAAEDTATPAAPASAAAALAESAAPAPAGGGDALAHLCNARDLRAARAWAAALDWKQRRRLPDEACVARLLERPGFAELRELLDLS